MVVTVLHGWASRMPNRSIGPRPKRVIAFWRPPSPNVARRLLWFKRCLPRYATRFIEMCVVLCADHGPCVSGECTADTGRYREVGDAPSPAEQRSKMHARLYGAGIICRPFAWPLQARTTPL